MFQAALLSNSFSQNTAIQFEKSFILHIRLKVVFKQNLMKSAFKYLEEENSN